MDLGSFESFIKEDTETQAAAAEKAYRDALRTFVGKKIDIRVIAQTRRRIALLRAPLAKSILRFMASADLRRLKCLAGVKLADPLLLRPFAPFLKSEMEQIEG